jgi:hypothetical protein
MERIHHRIFSTDREGKGKGLEAQRLERSGKTRGRRKERKHD